MPERPEQRRDEINERPAGAFFRHFANHSFVGDIFTVNGTAYPRRKYRFRFRSDNSTVTTVTRRRPSRGSLVGRRRFHLRLPYVDIPAHASITRSHI